MTLGTGGPPKKGKTNDAFLSVITPLCVGDPFLESSARVREYRKKRKLAKKLEMRKIDPDFEEFRPFIPSGQAKNDKNDIFLSLYDRKLTKGQMRKAYDRILKERMKKITFIDGVVPIKRRNIITSPAKVGSYGCVGITLAERTKEGRKTLEYMTDPYENRRCAREISYYINII